MIEHRPLEDPTQVLRKYVRDWDFSNKKARSGFYFPALPETFLVSQIISEEKATVEYIHYEIQSVFLSPNEYLPDKHHESWCLSYLPNEIEQYELKPQKHSYFILFNTELDVLFQSASASTPTRHLDALDLTKNERLAEIADLLPQLHSNFLKINHPILDHELDTII